LGNVEQNHIDIARQRPVLEAVVEDVNVDIESVFGEEAGPIAVSADDNGHLGQRPSQQRGLVSHIEWVGLAFLSRGENNHFLAASTAIAAS
jgi:hypothetical protein